MEKVKNVGIKIAFTPIYYYERRWDVFMVFPKYNYYNFL